MISRKHRLGFELEEVVVFRITRRRLLDIVKLDRPEASRTKNTEFKDSMYSPQMVKFR